MTGFTVLLLAIAIVTEVFREICFKLAADKEPVENRGYLFGLLFRPMIWLGFILWAVELISWIMVLARAPLSIAFPIMSLCYCGVLVASHYILGEKITGKKILGVIAITIGVAIVGSVEI